MLPRRYRVRRVRRENADTFTMELEASDPERTAYHLPRVNSTCCMCLALARRRSQFARKTRNGLEHTTRTVGHRYQGNEQAASRRCCWRAWSLMEAAGRWRKPPAGMSCWSPGASDWRRCAQPCNTFLARAASTAPGDAHLRRPHGRRHALSAVNCERLCDRGLQLYVTVNRATGNWRGNVGVVTALIPRVPFDPLNCIGHGMRARADDALLDGGVDQARRARAENLPFAGAQHEVCRRLLRPLPVRARVSSARMVRSFAATASEDGSTSRSFEHENPARPETCGLEVRLVRRVPVDAPGLRGRIACDRRADADRKLRRGVQRGRSRDLTTCRSWKARSLRRRTPTAFMTFGARRNIL